jgi:sphingolipid delta-4 desaturase
MSQTKTLTASSKKTKAPSTPLGPNAEYIRVDYHQPHWTRKKQIVEAHPEVKDLFEPDFMTFYYTLALVVFMVVLTYYVKEYSWWTIFAVAYCIGAVVDHALWVLIHDGSHNLVCKSKTGNLLFLLLANLPHVIPTSMSFRYYHLLHHTHLNETYMDPDLPGILESKILGFSTPGKVLWLLLFPLFQGLRVSRFTQETIDFWMCCNYAVQILFSGSIVYFWGAKAIGFLIIGSLFAIGLHPLGTRWIAEHYAVHPNQETYSHYGWLNRIAFNIGYHNEHHDLVKVPWSKLPAVKAAAPEFYDGLYVHSSYISLLWKFFTDDNFTLRSRVVRGKTLQ